MISPLLLSLALTVAPQSSQRPGLAAHHPLRNTFVTAAESLIDTAAAVNLEADDPAAPDQIRQLNTYAANLKALAADTGDPDEQDAVDAGNDLVFAVTACQLQARSNADTAPCRAQVTSARRRAMDAIRYHKQGNAWVPGPPSN